MSEDEIISLFGRLTDWRYLRESEIQAEASLPRFSKEVHHFIRGATVVAYSVKDGMTVRVWWVSSHIDGIEPGPLDKVKSWPDPVPHILVDPRSIKCGVPSKPFQPWRAPTRYVPLEKRPTHLDRWARHVERHRVCIIRPPGWFRRTWVNVRVWWGKK